MKDSSYKSFPIIGWILLILSAAGCNPSGDHQDSFSRFEQRLFSIHEDSLRAELPALKQEYPDFLPVFTEHVIGIGLPDDPNIARYLNQFISDPVIREIYALSEEKFPDFSKETTIISRAIRSFQKSMNTPPDIRITTYISGFNQSFITLPDQLAIGIDNYLGSDCTYYKQLRLPDYLIQYSTPEQVIPDGVRAWITSEMDRDFTTDQLIDQMIYDGMIYVATIAALGKSYHQDIFRYSEEQWNWCEQNEKAVWTYLVENELLFSSEQILIKRMTGEAPFTRDFGTDAPPRLASWIGYRIVDKMMRKTKIQLEDLFQNPDPASILSQSGYSP